MEIIRPKRWGKKTPNQYCPLNKEKAARILAKPDTDTRGSKGQFELSSELELT